MSNPPLNKTGNKSVAFPKIEPGSTAHNRNSFHFYNNSKNGQSSSIDNLSRPHLFSKYSYGSNGSSHSSYDRNKDPSFWDHQSRSRSRQTTNKKAAAVPKSSGLAYSSKINREFSSVDKINDTSSNTLICAGKAHLGVYKFYEQTREVSLLHDFSPQNYSSVQMSPLNASFNKRHRQLKLSSIADVKTGFHNYKNYVAVCTNSTVISLYDVNRVDTLENPLICSLSEHTRAVNSFDFNMIQNNLLVSGGQDGNAKIWDLRSNSVSTTNRCDLNINTAADSIRDIKWMPGYNFSHLPAADTKQLNNTGYKFASIHDSGLLLKYDIRQPSHPEKKINAHTGPGLCLNWHPNQDYIATGGRDGKCCLWYMGDGHSELSVNNTNILTPHSGINFLPVSATGTLTLPEITINTGFPVTKLKFRPYYEENVMNSLIAISSMGDEAEVGIYSFSRKYIPKHVLLTTAPSLGVVWYDENLIFNIDRGNRINGWDIGQEPTVLENLPKNIASWRDMDGSGFLFVNQESGSYEMKEPYTPIAIEKMRRQSMKLKNDNLDGLQLNKTKFGESTEKVTSHPNISSYFSDKGNLPRSLHSLSNKNLSNLNFSNNGNVQNPFLSVPVAFNDELEVKNISSPYMMTMNLPVIFNKMRESKMKRKKLPANEISDTLSKESPIEIFQFLARELEFSFSKDRKPPDQLTLVGEDHSMNDKNSQNDDLMQKFGFKGMTTWTNLMNPISNSEHTDKSIELRSNMSDSVINETIKDPDNKEKKNESSQPPENQTSRRSSNAQNKISDDCSTKVDLILELISVCKHNASVYSYINDLPNFKTWIIIRDSLLWDLKTLGAAQESVPTIESDNNDAQFQYYENLSNENHSRRSSNFTQSTKLQSEIGSTSRQKIDNFTFTSSQNLSQEGKMSTLQKQMKGAESLMSEMLDHQKKDSREKSYAGSDKSDSDSVAVEGSDQYDEQELDVNSKNGNHINKIRSARLSFIDTFMTNEKPTYLVKDTSSISKESFNLQPGSISPISKLSSLRSYSNAPSFSNNFKKLDSLRDYSNSPMVESSPMKFPELSAIFSNTNLNTVNSINEAVPFKSQKDNDKSPPWCTRKLLKQLFNQAIETGNILMAIAIMTLFQDLYSITTFDVVKESLHQFIDILHRYELFEIATALLKYCPWENILDGKSGYSLVQIFCEKCGKLVTNEESKKNFTAELQQTGNKEIMKKFGSWYCDNCRKPNTPCVICERPMKGLTMTMLDCGHEGHFECLKCWYLEDAMDVCPAGC